MKYITSFFLLLFFISSQAQERISNYVSENFTSRWYIKVVDEVKYLIEIDHFHNVNVNILNEDFNITSLHTRNFEGIYRDHRISFYNDLILAFDRRTPVIYDFVNDDVKTVDLPDGWYPTFWQTMDGGRALFRCTDINNSITTNFLVDLNGSMLASGEEIDDVLQIYGDYFFNYGTDEVLGQTIYYLEHIESGVRDTIMRDVNQRLVTAHEDLITYVNTEGQVVTMNVYTGQKSIIPTLNVDHSTVYDIHIIGDYLLLRDESDNYDDSAIVVYDIHSGNQLDVFTHSNLYNYSLQFIQIVDNKVVVPSHSDLFIFDFDSEEKIHYNTSYSEVAVPIIDDRYIFNPSRTGTSFIDLQTGAEFPVYTQYDIRAHEYAGVVELGNMHLGIFQSNGRPGKQVFRMNLTNKTIDHAYWLDNKNEGFDVFSSRMVELEEGLCIVSDNVFSVEVDTVVQLNTADLIEVNYSPYKLIDEIVGFLSPDDEGQEVLYSFDGKTLMEEAIIPNDLSGNPFEDYRVDDYIITEENVFFTASYFISGGLFRYNKSTGETERLLDIYPGFSFGSAFCVNEEDTYYSSGNEVYHISNEGEVTLLHEVSNSFGIDEVLHSIGNNCYMAVTDTIFALEGNIINPVFTGNFEILFSRISRSSDATIFQLGGEGRNSMLLLDNEEFTFVEYDLAITDISAYNNKHFLVTVQDFDNGIIERYVFDASTKTNYSLPAFPVGNRMRDIFFVDWETFILRWSHTSNLLYLYLVSNDFSDATLIQELEGDKWIGNQSVFRDFEGDRILNAHSVIAKMDDNYNFDKLDLKGARTEMFDTKEGYFYFWATDVDHGMQLYRIPKTNWASGTADVSGHKILNINPNPASEYIQIEEHWLGNEYNIHDTFGRTVQKGKLSTNKIILKFEEIGIFYLSISTGNRIQTTSFVKM